MNAEYASSLGEEYTLRLFDKGIYDYAIHKSWSADLCSQFADYNDYSQRGIGFAVIYQGVPPFRALRPTLFIMAE
jgi:hypothetical protein